MKRIISIVIILLLLSGCWDYKEIEDGIAVSAISFDTGNNKKYTFGTEIITGEKETKAEYLFEDCDSMREGIENISKYLNGELYFGHTETLIIGNGIDKEGFKRIIFDIMGDTDFRDSMVVVMADSSASDILLSQKTNSTIIGYEIPKIIENRGENSFSTVYKISERLKTDTKNNLVATLAIGEDNRIKYNGTADIWKKQD